MRPVVWLGLAAAVSACAGDDQPVGPAWVEIGAGADQFAPLADGDSVSIVLGPQGGFMVALALRTGGIVPGDPSDPTDPDNPRVTFRIVPAGGGDPFGVVTEQRGVSAAGDDGYELAGSWLIFNPALDTADYFDQMVDLSVTVVDRRGESASDGVSVTALAPATASLHRDVDPGEVVGRAGDHPEHAAGEVGDPHLQAVAGDRVAVGGGAAEAALERLVAHRAVVGRLGVDQRAGVAGVDVPDLVADVDVGIGGRRDVEEDLAARPRDHRVGPLDVGPRRQQEVIAGQDVGALLGHGVAPVAVGLGLCTLEVDAMPAGALERRPRALLEGLGPVADRRRRVGAGDPEHRDRCQRPHDFEFGAEGAAGGSPATPEREPA